MNVADTMTIHGKHCSVWISKRPHYCDRGNFLAHLEVDAAGYLRLGIDEADLWPRYYFDEERMKLEILAWLHKRGEWVSDEFVVDTDPTNDYAGKMDAPKI